MMLARGLRPGARKEISAKLRGSRKVDYKFDNIWECLDAIKSRNTHVFNADIVQDDEPEDNNREHVEWLLNPDIKYIGWIVGSDEDHLDMYMITPGNLVKSIHNEDKDIESFVKNALSIIEGRCKLDLFLSAK
jgi:hypothetical protein